MVARCLVASVPVGVKVIGRVGCWWLPGHC